MADLLNEQWELGGVVFGVDSFIGHEASVAPGGRNWRVQDVHAPQGDSTSFGRDFLEPDVWAFELFTDQFDESSALGQLQELSSVWLADEVRSTPGAVTELRYRIADRTRVVYGRPRKFDYTLDNRVFGGYIPITCDFKLASPFYYDDFESSMRFGAAAPVSGGFRTPLRPPIRISAGSSIRPNTFAVGGERSAPMVVEIHGPVTDAFVDIDGVRMVQLRGQINANTTVYVDARPWVMSAYLGRRVGRRELPEPADPPATAEAHSGHPPGRLRWL
jgi:hypothetical protein